jgi:hypothetical protein
MQMNIADLKNVFCFFIMIVLLALAITSKDAIKSNVYALVAIIIGALIHHNHFKKNNETYEKN